LKYDNQPHQLPLPQRLDAQQAGDRVKLWKDEKTGLDMVECVRLPGGSYVNPADAPKTVLGTQVGGSHYTSCKIQPIEYIWANGLGFSEGNIVKYVTRWKAKGGIKDLKKAQHHIALLIEHAEAEGIK
jgi:hypothetical protein